MLLTPNSPSQIHIEWFTVTIRDWRASHFPTMSPAEPFQCRRVSVFGLFNNYVVIRAVTKKLKQSTVDKPQLTFSFLSFFRHPKHVNIEKSNLYSMITGGSEQASFARNFMRNISLLCSLHAVTHQINRLQDFN